MLCLIIQILLISIEIDSLKDKGRSPFCAINELTFKKWMLKPNSWLHHLFFNKNSYYSKPFHIKPYALIILLFYLTSIINIALGFSILVLEITGKEINILIYIFIAILFSFFILQGIICVVVDVIDSDNSEKKLTKKEYEELIEYIEKFYPDFFKIDNKN